MESPDYLSHLIDKIPKNSPKPTKEHIGTIITLDEAVNGSSEELKEYLKILEDHARDEQRWKVGNYGFFRDSLSGESGCEQFLGERRTKNMELIKAEHEKRLAALKTTLPNFAIEDGGIKSEGRIETKLQEQLRLGRTLRVADCSRARIICDGLKDLENTYHDLEKKFIPANRQTARVNFYSNSESKYPTPFRGMNTYWTTEAHQDFPSMQTEIQLVTKNIRGLLDLNHSFDISKIARYPNGRTRAWVQRLFYKASIVDFKDL